MKIEKIERSKHRQERILVFLEGGDLLRISEEDLLHFGLYQGLDISPETVVELKKSGEASKTREKAVRLVSAHPISCAELRKRLLRGGAEEADADRAVGYLERIGALDDEAYAAMLVRHYSARGYGAARLRSELFQRGVPRELWEDALHEAPPAEETIDAFLARRLHGEEPDEKERKRLQDTLLRRGFRRSEVDSALRSLGANTEEEDS